MKRRVNYNEAPANQSGLAVSAPQFPMKKKHDRKETTPVINVDQTVSMEEQIARRAHEIWQLRGREHGNDWMDWLQAESEITEWHHKRLHME